MKISSFRQMQLMVISAFILISISGCDDRLKNIIAYGQIVKKDVCTQNGTQAWIMNLDLSRTEKPTTDMIIPVKSDTVNGKKYDNLIRVFVNIVGVDTVGVYDRTSSFRLDSVTETCSSSPVKGLSNYKAL